MKANAAKAAPFGRERVSCQTYMYAAARKKKEGKRTRHLFNLIRVCKILCTLDWELKFARVSQIRLKRRLKSKARAMSLG